MAQSEIEQIKEAEFKAIELEKQNKESANNEIKLEKQNADEFISQKIKEANEIVRIKKEKAEQTALKKAEIIKNKGHEEAETIRMHTKQKFRDAVRYIVKEVAGDLQ
ncbi:MAG: hypothetical protein LRZ92_01200 [Methanosarcinaceae archaeon]|nr:hypothetical protein [Methanosarcinaceae archaeon]